MGSTRFVVSFSGSATIVCTVLILVICWCLPVSSQWAQAQTANELV